MKSDIENRVSDTGVLHWKRYTDEECQGLERFLMGKKLAFKVSKGKIKIKKGNTAGKTQYQTGTETKDVIDNLPVLTIFQFVQLFNEEMEYCS